VTMLSSMGIPRQK